MGCRATKDIAAGSRRFAAPSASAIEHDVRYLTIYSFSSENWRRPPDEVAMLMGLLKRFIRNDLAELHKNGVRVRIIGERDNLAADIAGLLMEAESVTKDNVGLTLIVAFNYGARQEIVAAARRLAIDVREGRLDADAIGEDDFAARLDTADLPDPDLIIRTSGEMRLSNFLLWQAAYAELVFLPILWPDFDDAAFVSALKQYAARERRFGAVPEPAAVMSAVVSTDDMSMNDEPRRGAASLASASAPTFGRASARLSRWGSRRWSSPGSAGSSSSPSGGRRRSSCCGNGSGSCIPTGSSNGSAIGALALAVAALFALNVVRSLSALATLVVGAAAVGWVASPAARAWAGAGVLYAGALVVSLGLLRDEPGYGLPAILWLFAVVWGTDVAAYFAGRLIGGPKLWPSVSPGKTWSGAMAGAFAGRGARPPACGLDEPDRPPVLARPCGRGRVGTRRPVRIGAEAALRRQGFEPPHSRPRRPHGPARRLHRGLRLRRGLRRRQYKGLLHRQRTVSVVSRTSSAAATSRRQRAARRGPGGSPFSARPGRSGARAPR